MRLPDLLYFLIALVARLSDLKKLMKVTIVLLVSICLLAFAANSILCRRALDNNLIGPVLFTLVRLMAGAFMLLPLLLSYGWTDRKTVSPAKHRPGIFKAARTDIYGALSLFCYALFFSLAYVRLEAGSGALILFATVQVTMIGISIVRGNRPTLIAWAGIAVSLAGLVYLTWPGLETPSLIGSIMMAGSGVSWGIYSVLGKRCQIPLLSTARNFMLTLPVVTGLGFLGTAGIINGSGFHATNEGLFLATLSGAFASAAGYAVWYKTLPYIDTTTASVSQLAVPVLVVFGGAVFLDETISLRTILASILIIIGILITIKTSESD